MKTCRNDNEKKEEFQGYPNPYKKKNLKLCIFLNSAVSRIIL